MSESRGVEPFDGADYARLRRSAGTHRQQLVVRLCGEVGLRPAEITRVRPADVRGRIHDGEIHYFLAVRDDAGERAREAYLPADVKRELDRYAESNGIAADEPLLGVSARRLQMLVGEVASDAADTESDPLAGVSTSDLRRRFARTQLRRGVPPAVVMAVGGWTRLDGFAADPAGVGRGSVAAAFARAGDAGDDRFRAAFDRLDRPAFLLDADGVVEAVNERFEAATGLDAATAAGRELRELAAAADEHAYSDVWETALAGETWRGTVVCGGRDGDAVEGELALSAIGGQPRPRGFVATFNPETTATAPGATERLARVQERILAVDESLASASTRDGVLHRLCDGLVDEAYRSAWMFDTPVEAGDPAVAAAKSADPPDAAAPLAAAAVADGVVTVRDAPAGGTLVAVPLSHGSTDYGALVVVVSEPVVSDHERRSLAALGGRVAGSLAAVEWKRLLLADAVLELELKSTDRDSLFVGASADLDCEMTVEGLVPLDGESLLYYVSAAGVSAERALEHFGDRAESARLIAAASDASLLEVTGDGDSLAGELIAHGANVTELTATDGTARIACEAAPNADVRELLEGVAAAFPTVELLAKREVERSVRTPTEFQQALEERLTDKQRSVLQAAYHAGYFDWPRGSTAEELADSIGVSSPTLHNHLRRAQRKLLAAFFDGDE